MSNTTSGLPPEFGSRALVRRGIPAAVGLLLVIAVVVLAPGLDEVRRSLSHADPAWLAAAVALELLSCLGYALMFRPLFCQRMSRRLSVELSAAELGVGSLVPTSGAAGLALGGWFLHEGGMKTDRVARRSVAFFLVKSSVNFFAVALIGGLMALGVVGPPVSLLLTLLPAMAAVIVIAVVIALPRLDAGSGARRSDRRAMGWLRSGRRALIGGSEEAIIALRPPAPQLIIGAVGYWLFDNAVLWAAFLSLGVSVPLTIVLMGYLIGQLGGALPIPGGVGGIDLGLIGMLVLYGAPAGPAAAAVLIYRLILFWLPLLLGVGALVALRARLKRPGGMTLDVAPRTPATAGHGG